MNRLRVSIPEDELQWRFSRSSGPGGQHVNTSDTRVELLWEPASSRALDAARIERIVEALAARMVDGHVVVGSSRYRSQARNRDDARAKLNELVSAALVVAPRRHASRPSRGAQRRREQARRQRSQIKRDRRSDWS